MHATDDAAYPGCPATVINACARGVVLRPARWGIGDVLAMVALSIVLALAGGWLLKSLDAPLGAIVITGALLGWTGMAGWPILATITRGNGPRIDLGLSLTWRDARTGLLGGVTALIVAGLLTVILVRVFGTFTSSAGAAATRLIESGDRLSVVLFAVMIVVGAPIVEELAFRGLVFGAARKQGLSAGWSIVVSAGIFALVHFEPVRIILLFGIGGVLGAVRARTGSTGASIVAHVIVNAPGGLFLLLGVPGVTP